MLASHGTNLSVEIGSAFKIHLSAAASAALDDALKVLTGIALAILLASDIGHLLAKEALIISMTAVIRSPKFKIRAFGSSVVNSLALGLMKPVEVQVHKNSFASL